MNAQAENSTLFQTVPTAEAYLDLSRKLDRVVSLLEQQGGKSDGKAAYIEPGPGSPRQYFTAAELAERWGWGKTKVYELTEIELPAWRHGGQVRYFWAYVWHFEKRISRAEADKLWTDYGSVQTSKLTVLPHPAKPPARLRQARAN